MLGLQSEQIKGKQSHLLIKRNKFFCASVNQTRLFEIKLGVNNSPALVMKRLMR